jgi:hypothetical protein
MNDWNIQSRAHVCQGCGGPFADKQAYHTLLFDDKQVLHRLDVCDACWQGQYRHGTSERKGFISYWQGIYEAPPAAPSDPIQKASAESLLRKLIELNDPKYIPAGYILAVMLERKRILKVKEQMVRDGQRVFVYEHAKEGDVFTVPDPDLQLNQLEQVQRDVAALLEHGLPDPAATVITSPDAQPQPASTAPDEPTPGEAACASPPAAAAKAADIQPAVP